MLNCGLICWNWNYEAAGVVCRLHKKERSMFKFGKSLEDVVTDMAESTTLQLDTVNED